MKDKKVRVVSFSGGKDSTAMLHILLEKGITPDFVVFFQTDWEFPQLLDHINKVESKTGLKITRIRFYRHFDDLLEWYGWPGYKGGWCTARKTDTIMKFIRAVKGNEEYIGFSLDEIDRSKRKGVAARKWRVKFPLIEEKIDEKTALKICYDLGYDFGGLYEVFDRVSCFCCPNAGKRRIKILKEEFPSLYEEYERKHKLAQKKLIDNFR